MQNFQVTDIRWASEGELSLPLWQDWNKKNKLSQKSWQEVWAAPYFSSKVPPSAGNMSFSPTSGDRGDEGGSDYLTLLSRRRMIADLVEDLKKMMRIARHRVVVVVPVSDQSGLPVIELQVLEDFLGCRIPLLPFNALRADSSVVRKYKHVSDAKNRHTRLLAITLDAVDVPRSVAVLIPHWESYRFLKPCLIHIIKNRDPLLKEKIYVLDDESQDGSFDLARKEFARFPFIEFYQIRRHNKKNAADIGLLLDEGLKLVSEQFSVMLDADTLPLSIDWIAFPIWLLEKYRSVSVGLDTGLSNSYYQDAWGSPLWQPESGYMPGFALYDNEWFSCTNNLYRVMRTADARVVSEGIGFTRANSESRTVGHYFRDLIALFERHGFSFKNIYRALFQKKCPILQNLAEDRYPYLRKGCDNGVAANHFMDINRLGPKINIPITSFIGLTPHDGVFGQNIGGLLFHFALSTRALSRERREVFDVGVLYEKWVEILSSDDASFAAILEEMIAASASFKPGGYDGTIPADWYRSQYERVRQLQERYRTERSAR